MIAGGQRPVLPEFAESATKRFRVHYTRVGADAVPASDDDVNGIPDFVESCLAALELAWTTYTTIGYVAPPNDGEAGGSSAIDVYLHDLSKAGSGGTGWYGNTVPEQRVASGPPERYTAWMEFDNDFSADDRNLNGNPVYATIGIDALKVTCAHELHHVFQIGSYGTNYVQTMLYEFSSTWMEQRLFPEIPDWVSYSSNLFKLPAAYPFSSYSGSNGYAWGFYGNILHAHGGDGLLLNTWERIGANEPPFTALVHGTQDVGKDFSAVFCQELGTFYHTASRDNVNDGLRFGSRLPEIMLTADQRAVAPSELATGTLRAFEVKAYRFAIPSSVTDELVSTAIIVTWPDQLALQRAVQDERIPYSLTLTSTPLPTDIPIGGTHWAVRVQPPELCVWVDGQLNQRIGAPYPQPVHLKTSRTVYVPTPTAQHMDNVDVRLLTMEYVVKQRSTITVQLDANRLVIPLQLESTVGPGMYLVECRHNGITTLTKLVVRE
ncbi:MAG: hypothetical protein J5I53_04250 [Bradyrhizobiaceae bacterium]|nr:hypothetical protein [Bradyrhizobiaceae bacterium]